MDVVQWWYEIGGVKHGPCSAERLRELIAGGQIGPSNLLWQKGLDNWIQAGATAEFAGAFAPQEPPPLPKKPLPIAPSAAGQAGAPISTLDSRDAIWNPNAAANWSIIFTPAFGSYLHMLNWRVLGQSDRAASAQHWFYVSLAVLVTYVVMGALIADSKAADSAAQGLAFLFLLVWYFASGRSQAKYIKEKFGSNYSRKPWGAALCIGIAAVIGFFICVYVVGVATQQIMQRMVKAAIPPSVAPATPTQSTAPPTVDRFGGVLVDDGKPTAGPSIKPFPDGQNTLTWPDGRKYVGEFKDGNRHGQGTLTFPSGERYVGEFRDDKANGQGTITLPNGQKYIGEFRDDNRHGQGTLTWPEGAKYVGEFRDDLSNGQGTYTWPSGQKYVGEFKDGKQHGQGTLTFPNGAKYVGEFRDDNRNGQGTQTRPDGEKYIGEFKDGQFNGQGTEYRADGRKYVGEFKDGNRYGQGTMTWPNGQKYVGEFRDSKRYGQGTYTFPSGAKYVGEFRDDNRNGQGIVYSADGTILQSGIWENDVYVGGR